MIANLRKNKRHVIALIMSCWFGFFYVPDVMACSAYLRELSSRDFFSHETIKSWVNPTFHIDDDVMNFIYDHVKETSDPNSQYFREHPPIYGDAYEEYPSLTTIELAFLLDIHERSRVERRNLQVLEIAGGYGRVYWKIPFAFHENNGVSSLYSYFPGYYDPSKIGVPSFIDGHSVLLEENLRRLEHKLKMKIGAEIINEKLGRVLSSYMLDLGRPSSQYHLMPAQTGGDGTIGTFEVLERVKKTECTIEVPWLLSVRYDSYDVIYVQNFEHLLSFWDDVVFMGNLAYILRPGGRAYLSAISEGFFADYRRGRSHFLRSGKRFLSYENYENVISAWNDVCTRNESLRHLKLKIEDWCYMSRDGKCQESPAAFVGVIISRVESEEEDKVIEERRKGMGFHREIRWVDDFAYPRRFQPHEYDSLADGETIWSSVISGLQDIMRRMLSPPRSIEGSCTIS